MDRVNNSKRQKQNDKLDITVFPLQCPNLNDKQRPPERVYIILFYSIYYVESIAGKKANEKPKLDSR